jgi:hypothetical protein
LERLTSIKPALSNTEGSMSDLDLVPADTSARQARPRRGRRSDRPERIWIGGEEMVRNDVLAQEQGGSERSINRGDPRGAPYLYLNGVKYRPLKRYHQYLLGRIQVRNQPKAARGAASMTDIMLTVIVLGSIAIALAVDLAAVATLINAALKRM